MFSFDIAFINTFIQMIINGFQRSIKILIIDHVIQCYKEQRQYDKSLYHSFFYFFVNYLAVPRATLGYFLRNNLTHLVLVIFLFSLTMRLGTEAWPTPQWDLTREPFKSVCKALALWVPDKKSYE